jgi:cation diffusion facilitator family transporter
MAGASEAATGERAQQSSARSLPHDRDAGASRKTVIVALVANACIAVTKLFGGMMSGSTALLAEAAHSLADTTNQIFLLVSIRLSRREPDEERPFGHGQQRFLWTFVSAVGMFVAGAVFAIGYGVLELLAGEKQSGGFAVAWVTLAIALVAEGVSWVRAMRQTRGEAREAGKPTFRYARESRDPNVKMVLFEDSAALVGIAIAGAGLGLDQITGQTFWDPAASVLIGVLLIGVAISMARDAGHLLVGSSATEEERAAIEEVIERHPAVVEVRELLTMILGPSSLLVAARVDLEDDVCAGRLETAMSEVDRAVRDAVPDVTEVFLDPTPGTA